MITPRKRSFTGWCKRFMVRWAGQFLVAFFATAGGFGFVLARGVFLTPGRLDALTVKVDTLASALRVYQSRTDTLHREQSVSNAFKCFELPDSIFRHSLLPCGEAFIASRVDPVIWRKVKP